MLDDFHDAYAFMEYREYGEDAQMKLFGAFSTNGDNPNHGGEICVFLNFKLLGRFKKKSEALAMVKRLIAEAPSRDFEKYDSISGFLE